jgi:hypothetical protein
MKKEKRHIMDLSVQERSAIFAQAGRKAVEKSRRLGLPITGTKDGQIVTTYPDGREEVLKDLRPSFDSEGSCKPGEDYSIPEKRHITDLSVEEQSAIFAQAGRKAVERALKAGLPVTGTKDGRIVEIYPDGREEVIGNLPSWPTVGLGWQPIVERLIEVLGKLPEPPAIEEIKEKYGELRVYLATSRPDEEALIEAAEAEASRTCEMCGEPGILREDLPWMQVLCDRHYGDRE